MGAYLFTYFKDDTHSLYFAVSDDGYTFTDVNNGQPIIAGDTIAEQKGIRDRISIVHRMVLSHCHDRPAYLCPAERSAQHRVGA